MKRYKICRDCEQRFKKDQMVPHTGLCKRCHSKKRIIINRIFSPISKITDKRKKLAQRRLRDMYKEGKRSRIQKKWKHHEQNN